MNMGFRSLDQLETRMNIMKVGGGGGRLTFCIFFFLINNGFASSA